MGEYSGYRNTKVIHPLKSWNRFCNVCTSETNTGFLKLLCVRYVRSIFNGIFRALDVDISAAVLF